MQTSIAVQSQSQSLLERCLTAALQGLSPATRRVYQSHIRKYLAWANAWANNTLLDRETVKKYIRALELQGASPQVRNQALAALKKLAYEAGELGWIDASAAVRVQAIKSARITGIRTGRWLTVEQTAQLLASPDRTKVIGKRDACVLALLVGCGLRRVEACELDTAQLRQVNGRTIITNLVGKGGRVRSVSVPVWAQTLIDEWHKQIKQVQKETTKCNE